MIRRPPRSTRTHSFPTRRASDLQRVENSRVWIVRAFRILPQLIPAVDSTEELIPRIIGAAFPQRVGVEQHMHAVLRNSAHPVDGSFLRFHVSYSHLKELGVGARQVSGSRRVIQRTVLARSEERRVGKKGD